MQPGNITEMRLQRYFGVKRYFSGQVLWRLLVLLNLCELWSQIIFPWICKKLWRISGFSTHGWNSIFSIFERSSLSSLSFNKKCESWERTISRYILMKQFRTYQTCTYSFKLNSKNTRTRCKICLHLVLLLLILIPLLLILNNFHILTWWFHCCV